MSRRVLPLVLLLAGCAPEQSYQPLPADDVDVYIATVHPIMEARCGTIDCHGDPRRPLRLYSETGLRMGADRDLPLTAEEYAANALALVSIDPTPARLEQHLVLSKPVRGGVDHQGGVLWDSVAEPQYVCVRGWLGGTASDPVVVSACALAADEVVLPPPSP